LSLEQIQRLKVALSSDRELARGKFRRLVKLAESKGIEIEVNILGHKITDAYIEFEKFLAKLDDAAITEALKILRE
jgi:hypothetical protein